MSITWADNFDNYGTNSALPLNGIYSEWDGVDLVTDPDPSASGRAARFNFPSAAFSPFWGDYIRYTYPTADTTKGMSARLWLDDLPSSNAEDVGFVFTNAANSPQVTIKVNTDGSITAMRGAVDTNGVPINVLGTSAPLAVTANSWNHIEWKVFTDVAAGTVEVRVNGVTVLDLTAQNTAAGPISSATFYTTDQNGTISGLAYLKDVVYWDTTGTQNNDFIGTAHVYTLLPDADDTLTWTPSAGATGWNLVDEQNPVSDADYISAGDPPPAPNVFTVTDLPPDIVTVKALIPVVRARKIDGGDGNVQTGLTGTLTDLGADRPITTAFTYFWDVSELSPDTAVAWTPTETNNVKFQIDRTI